METSRTSRRHRVVAGISLSLTLWICPAGARAESDAGRPAHEDTQQRAVSNTTARGAPPAEGPQANEQMRVSVGRASGSAAPGLDALLQLPTGYTGQAPAQSVAGAGEAEWRRRFSETRKVLAAAREKLESTKRELDGAAGQGGSSQWSIAPPGGLGGSGGEGPASTSPLSFKLRQALKQSRLDLDEAEKNMRELQIEANLAGVPKAWHGAPEAQSETPSEVGQLLD